MRIHHFLLLHHHISSSSIHESGLLVIVTTRLLPHRLLQGLVPRKHDLLHLVKAEFAQVTTIIASISGSLLRAVIDRDVVVVDNLSRILAMVFARFRLWQAIVSTHRLWIKAAVKELISLVVGARPRVCLVLLK